MCAAFIAVMATAGLGEVPRTTYEDLRFAGVERQGLEQGCAAASLVTILNGHFGETLDEMTVWNDYLATMSTAQQELALHDGLAISDIVAMSDRLDYRAVAVRIGLLDLAATGRPAILYLERSGVRDFRHFVVFRSMEGTRVHLLDSVLGNRRIRVEQLLREWRGQAIFILPKDG
jgi:predicted double-glycine peptidase